LQPLVDQLKALGETVARLERAIHAQHRSSDASLGSSMMRSFCSGRRRRAGR
jgi:hypothetical protein